MRMTAGEFIGLLNRQGIECRIHRGRIVLTGEECDMLNSLRAVLKGNPSFERRIVRHIEEATRMTAGEYLRECENAGVMLQIDTWGSDIDMAGGNERTRARLCNILTREPRLKAEVILHEAMKDPDLMYSIQERASIRWSNGYSDSLLSAVLCGITSTCEEIERGADGEIIMKPRQDWSAELARVIPPSAVRVKNGKE